MAMGSTVPHQCAIDSMPSRDTWDAMAGKISLSAARRQSFIEQPDLASDKEGESHVEDK